MSWEASYARIDEIVALDAATPGGLKPEDIADETDEFVQTPEHFRDIARVIDPRGTGHPLATHQLRIADELERHGRAEWYSMSDGKLYRSVVTTPNV